eukprot:COSAG02_NODE_15433_length_1172_cov_0.697111_1_plen_270_part_10
MTLAAGVVEECDGNEAGCEPTTCTLNPGTDGTGGSCTVSGGGQTPGTCTYVPAAAAQAGSCSAGCTYVPPPTSCGYAPIVEIVADHADWPAPGWYSGPMTVDATMDSPLECQARCFQNSNCDYFSYEWELTAGVMYHECYLKTEYDDANCMVDPYVPWASQDTQWHGQSGPGIACASVTELELACGAFPGMDYGGNPSYGGPEGCSTGTLTPATDDVAEGCTMTLAAGVVEECDGNEAGCEPTTCTLVPGTDGTGGSCTVSGGGQTPGTC